MVAELCRLRWLFVIARGSSFRCLEHALEIDPLDPFANFTLGRSLWLTDNVEGSLSWLDRAIALCPNYAQGIYARACAETVLGMGEEAQRHADTAIALSPIDPLRYAMLGTHALSHLVRTIVRNCRGARPFSPPSMVVPKPPSMPQPQANESAPRVADAASPNASRYRKAAVFEARHAARRTRAACMHLPCCDAGSA
ncbi:MAG TPA: tetratricopeptide repeat protein [Sphingomonas sp.]|nr:tetratricopeptide repeat protein [Sphingomonas sp.]